jgi:hypothetical protein
VASALVLVLDIRVNQDRHGPNSESRVVLRDLANVVSRHTANSKCPGSIRILGKIVVDVNSAAEQSTRLAHAEHSSQTDMQQLAGSPTGLPATPATSIPYSPRQMGTPSSVQNLLAFPVDPTIQNDPNTSFRGQLFDPATWSTSLSFMDEPGNNWQDWTWDDIETIVRR